MSEDHYKRRCDWQVFDVHTPVFEPAESLRKRLEQGKELERQIEDAAELLVKRVGSLTIVAIAEGRDHVPLLQDSELDFLDDLPRPDSAPDISDAHKRMLQDMTSVRYKLRPLCVKSAGHRPARLSRPELWQLCDRLDAALIGLRGPVLGDILAHAMMKGAQYGHQLR